MVDHEINTDLNADTDICEYRIFPLEGGYHCDEEIL